MSYLSTKPIAEPWAEVGRLTQAVRELEQKLAKLEEVDRNARAYGYEIGRGQEISKQIETSEDNPFLDLNWRGTLPPGYKLMRPRKRQQMTGEAKTNIQVGTREWMVSASEGRHPSVAQVLRHFAYAHLPERLQVISGNCANLALQMCAMIPDDPELVVGLRKLLEAKDCFVRAALGDQ